MKLIHQTDEQNYKTFHWIPDLHLSTNVYVYVPITRMVTIMHNALCIVHWKTVSYVLVTCTVGAVCHCYKTAKIRCRLWSVVIHCNLSTSSRIRHLRLPCATLCFMQHKIIYFRIVLSSCEVTCHIVYCITYCMQHIAKGRPSCMSVANSRENSSVVNTSSAAAENYLLCMCQICKLYSSCTTENNLWQLLQNQVECF